MTLHLLVLLGCSQPPWWLLGDAACPDGAHLDGTPWPMSASRSPPPDTLTKAEEEDYFSRYAVTCVTDTETLHGPYAAWYGNGQLRELGENREGRVIRAIRWDENGNPTCSLACTDGRCTSTLTWWHANGVKALEGADIRGKPSGTWREWNEAGRPTGELVFTEDGQREVIRAGSGLLRDAPASALSRSPFFAARAAVPESTSTVAPGLAVRLTITPLEVIIDGVPVLKLEQTPNGPALPSPHMRGEVVHQAYDRLVEKANMARRLEQKAPKRFAFMGTLQIEADPTLHWSVLRPLLYTAGQAQFSDFQLLALNPALQLPPRTGPERLQGPVPTVAVPLSLPKLGPPDLDAETTPVPWVRLTGDGMIAGRGAEPAIDLTAALGDLDTVVILPEPDQTMQELVSAADTARATGAQEVLLARSAEGLVLGPDGVLGVRVRRPVPPPSGEALRALMQAAP